MIEEKKVEETPITPATVTEEETHTAPVPDQEKDQDQEKV